MYRKMYGIRSLLLLVLLMGIFSLSAPAQAYQMEQPQSTSFTCPQGESGHHVPSYMIERANYTQCGGGNRADRFMCDLCGRDCKWDGGDWDWETDFVRYEPMNSQHAPNMQKLVPANYTECGGGYRDALYECMNCGNLCYQDGRSGVPAYGYERHTPGSAPVRQAGSTECGGNYDADQYECIVCHGYCTVDGYEYNGYYTPGTGEHTPGSEPTVPKNWTKCGGGYTEDLYTCKVCSATCLKNGSEDIERVYREGNGSDHTASSEPYQKGNQASCYTGWRVDIYHCTECGADCTAYGASLDYAQHYNVGAGSHSPDWSSRIESNYTACGGGYNFPRYICTMCGQECKDNGRSVSSEDFSPGYSSHFVNTEVLYPADYNACNGGINTEYYRCYTCQMPCDAYGQTIQPIPAAGAHTPDLDRPIEANYTVCGGGYKEDYYCCTKCGAATTSTGGAPEYWEPAWDHTPDMTKCTPANWTSCGGGYDVDRFPCKVCGAVCTEKGKAPEYVPGDGWHAADKAVSYPADYTVCGGGIGRDYYLCQRCEAAVDYWGNEIAYQEPYESHTPNENKCHPKNYTPCFGGYDEDLYECDECGGLCTADGGNSEYLPATQAHTPDETQSIPGDYTTCNGGYNEDYYACSVCGERCTADGATPVRQPGNDQHTPDSNTYTQWDYKPCCGGYYTDYYLCADCGRVVDGNGYSVNYEPATAEHQPNNSGVICRDCGTILDAEAITGDQDLVLPSGTLKIDEQAFMGNTRITSVYIGENCTTISNGAFMNCYDLNLVIIANGSCSIANDAFYGCSDDFVIVTEAGSNVYNWAKQNGYLVAAF